MYPPGEAWSGSRSRTVARALRRQRRAERGLSRSAALAARCKAFRVSLAAHWDLCDALGAHEPSLADAIRAAELVGLDVGAALDARASGNWCRHAPPPGAAALPPVPKGAASAEVIEEALLADASAGSGPAPKQRTALRGGARPFAPTTDDGFGEHLDLKRYDG